MTIEQRLFSLQADYKNGRTEALGEMYDELYTLAYKNVNKACEQRKELKELSAGVRQQKAHDAATYIIEQYIKRPDFEISKSFNGYVFLRVRKELCYIKEIDKLIDYTGTPGERTIAEKVHMIIVTDTETGKWTAYDRAEEIFLRPEFRTLRKKRFVQCVRTGTKWKQWRFDYFEEVL